MKRNRKINFRYNLKEYWSIIRQYKPILFAMIFVSIIVETLFVIDKFLFKRIIDDSTQYISNSLSKEVFLGTLLIIFFIFISIVIFRTIGKWINVHLLARLDGDLIFDIKRKYFNHIVGLSHEFHTTHKTGSLISRMNRGAGAVEDMTDIILFNFAPLIIQIIIVGLSLAYFGLMPAFVILLITIVFISYSFVIQHIQQKSRLEYNTREDFEKGMISDIFTNIDSIKYFGKENYIKRKYLDITNKSKASLIKYIRYYRWFDAGQIFILGIGTFFLIYFPLMNFLDNQITLGTLVFVYTIYGNVVGPMFGFVMGMRGFYRSMADFQDLFHYGKIENDIKDKPGVKDSEIRKGEIEFKNVSFHYGRKKAFSLNNFSLKIKKNEKVALVGHSGCGKTSLIKLLYRLYDVNSGEILIDEKNIKDFKQESLRSELSIVPQECVLFDDTIFNNIKFSSPKATRKQVFAAIKFAQLDKLIKNFPKKENTIVGERGVKLSGGEKQRVSIARAILANKKILVLDEATSALDSETENEIQRDLKKLLEGRTSIIIAHRLSTIMNSDRIIVLKGGKIIQQGKHSKLIKQSGEYKKLWNLQKGNYIK
tara:strand:- start:35 stop:1819 length:1785 start_codon:yes stop_codon:yes gene_type:complete